MKFILSLFSLTYLFVIGIALAVAGMVVAFQMPGPVEEVKEIQIQRGLGTQAIGQYLEDENLIYTKYTFLIGSQLMNGGKPLQAGEFEIPANASTAQILDILQNGKTIQRKFTIPEGQTSWQIVQILKDNEFLDGEIEDIPPEGSLMPETYFFSKGDSRLEKISRMQQAMASFVSEQDVTILEKLPLETMEEVVILASIVEKETSVPSEYAKVAGVFHNRLRIGMALQTDPTVIYGITGGKHQDDGRGPLGRRLLTRDLQQDTPFNTYTRTGLPPTPICNPGRAAITAVLNPADHDYLFFVADGTGGHAFAKTYKEHQANVAKWRKIRRSQQ